MPMIDPPIADAAGSALSRTDAGEPSGAPTTCKTDWRQLSHELRTPLNAILGNVELLLDGSAGPLSAQARACLGEVQIAGRQLLRQVQILLIGPELNVSRAVPGGKPLDLIALVREALTSERAATLQVEPPDARLWIYGDPLWLRSLVAEVVELGGATDQVLAIRLGDRAEGGAIRFSWSDFCAAKVGPLQMALIEAIAELQGAAAVLESHGLCLYWPLAQGDGAGAETVALDPVQANGADGHRFRPGD